MGERKRRSAPAALRNRGPILEVLRRALPESGLVLELGSGSGEHIIHFAAALPWLVWQPSDPDPQARASVEAWRRGQELHTLLPCLDIDARATRWRVSHAHAILAINVIHITPWSVCEGIVAGAGRTLGPGGLLYLYGPYRRGGRHTAASNEAFDRSLRARDPAWGVRDVADVESLAAEYELALDEVVEMPVNNLSLLLRHR